MIEISKDGPIWVITLNRPDKANALTADMLERLIETFEAARSVAKVIILTGAGSVFCAGADLDAARAGLATSPLWEQLSGAIADHPGLTIACMNGTLAGGAFGMVLACDLRLSVEKAKYFYPVMKLGFLPQPSDPKRMAALIGPARAKMILMAGEKVPAQLALEWGLIDRIVAPDELITSAMSLARDAIGADFDHVAGIKALF